MYLVQRRNIYVKYVNEYTIQKIVITFTLIFVNEVRHRKSFYIFTSLSYKRKESLAKIYI